MKKILVPIDFSTESENALDLAVQMARKNNTQIVLMHVIDEIVDQTFNTVGEIDPSNSSSFNNVYVLELVKKIKKDLNALIEKETYSDVKITTVLKTGGIYKRISEVIAKEQIDLVIMGSKGTSGIEELLIGSNTEKVIRHAKCPVLTVKELTDLSSIKKVLFASDLLTEQDHVVDKLKELVKLLDAELIIVKINTLYQMLSSENFSNQLDNFSKKHELSEAKIQVFDHINIEDGIVRFAEMEEVDMIAMGTHGRTGIAHVIAGSEAENLANHCKRLVWTYSY